MEAHVAEKIFTGYTWLSNSAVLVSEGLVIDTIPRGNIPDHAKIVDHANNFLVPGFLDLQIYGADGSLLSVKPTSATLDKIYAYCKAGGACYFQPTVATNTYKVVYECIDAVREYWTKGGKGVLGLHVEGPWINREKRGAHVESLIHPPTLEQAKTLLEYGRGVISMITLAPEVCSTQVIELIKSYEVIISAGHSNATFAGASAAFESGILVATHLYNAMSPLHHREPGIVGAIMHNPAVASSIVPDGYHVDFAAVAIAKKVMGERLFFITDAVTETHEGYYQHQPDGEKYVLNGILSGSALHMGKCVKNAVERVGIELSEALRMASLYPGRAMKMDSKLGKIAKGYEASFAVLDHQLEVVLVVERERGL